MTSWELNFVYESQDFKGAYKHSWEAQYTTLHGQSGVGKSTLVECLLGIRKSADLSGYIKVDDHFIFCSDRGIDLRLQLRPFAWVPQDTLLLPHLNVEQNVEMAGAEKESKNRDAILKLMGLASLQDRLPGGLSGGEQQRVAIARALVSSKPILLLDEPVSSLDVDARNQVLSFLQGSLQSLDRSVFMVSHLPQERQLLPAAMQLEVVTVDGVNLLRPSTTNE